jgi:aryl-alcohol dehydrogenase-like predicted oxidoreductase
MKYNLLADTGLLVSELCYGTMTFGGQGMWTAIGQTKQDEVNELMKTSFDSGINFYDTANIYSYGESETLLGQSIKDVGLNRDELVIASKVRGRMNDKPNSVGLSRYHIFNSVDQSLERLQMDHMDILYVHGVDKLTSIEEIMRTLNDVVAAGKVRYIAVCNWPAWMVMKAQAIAERNGWSKFVGLQYYYSLASRDIEREVVPLALDQNISIMPWSPLAGGFLTGKYKRETGKSDGSRRDDFDFPPIDKEKAYDIVDVLAEVAKNHDVSIAQVALAWVRVQQGVTSTIIGARRVDQLNDNIASVDIEFNDDELEMIENVSALAAEYPAWMVEVQSGDRK